MGERGVLRVFLTSSPPFFSHTPGSLRARRYDPAPLKPGEVRLAVDAAGTQFKDVMLAMGMLPGIPGDLGAEVAGTIVEVHPVTAAAFPELKLGLRVAAMCVPPQGGLASHTEAAARFCVPAPAHVSSVDLAASLSVYVTVLYSLRDRARLQPRETVLIHSVR